MSQSSVWTMLRRTTTSRFLRQQCLAPLVPLHSPPALGGPAPLSAAHQEAPCYQTAWGRTAGTMDCGPLRVVQEICWLGGTSTLSCCPRLHWTRPHWMTAHTPSPVPPSLAMPLSGRDTRLHPIATTLPIQTGWSPIKVNFEERID